MSDVFEFIQSNVHDHDVKQMCTVLEAPKSSYYDWKKKKPSKRQSENKRLNRLISGIYFENKGVSMVRLKFIRFLLAVARPCP